MYLQKPFEETRTEVLHELIAAHPLGLLVRHGPNGLVADTIPWLLEPGQDAEPGAAGTLVGHVARANPLWRELSTGDEVLVVFQGPQAYVSPGWYPSKAEHGKVVPTWNYAMVQARGRIVIDDDAAAVRRIVERLSARHEGGRARAWSIDDAPPDFIETLLRAIVGVRITVDSLVGKLKLSQNRAEADRAGVRDGLLADGGDERRAMVDWMQRLEAKA